MPRRSRARICPHSWGGGWLYAQFVTSKAMSLKKTLVGLTPIRESDINSQAVTDAAPRLGGLVEFCRSPARVQWTPTGTNVPDYPRLAQLCWQFIAEAAGGDKTPQEALDGLVAAQDTMLGRLGRSGVLGECDPKLNPARDPQYWLDQPGRPRPSWPTKKPGVGPSTMTSCQVLGAGAQLSDRQVRKTAPAGAVSCLPRILLMQVFGRVQGVFQQAGAGHRADAAGYRGNPAGAG